MKGNPTFKQRVGGMRAKKAGEGFENFLEAMARRFGVYCERIPDGCKQIRNRGGKLQLVRTTTPFDFVLCWNGRSAFIDAKTVEGKTFPHSKIVDHQLKSLTKVGEHCPSGYVVWFREPDVIALFTPQQLAELQKRDSLKPEDGLALGRSHMFDLRLIFGVDHAKGKNQIFDEPGQLQRSRVCD